MGREVRKIKAGWQHPIEGTYSDGRPRYKPLCDFSYENNVAEWDEGASKWEAGLVEDYSSPGKAWKPKDAEHEGMSYAEYAGERPDPDDYMPEWAEGEATKLVMYEDCTEGTPISPAFDTPEELARWLADNHASSFGSMTATYDQWLATIKAGWAPSMMIFGNAMMSGVEAVAETKEP